MKAVSNSLFEDNPSLMLLSRLLLCGREAGVVDTDANQKLKAAIVEISREEFDHARTLAESHHVIMRAMQIFEQISRSTGDQTRAEWAANAMASERARIENALSFLKVICDGLESAGCEVIVIKSLDHWPDLGSDLDLYTDAEPAKVVRLMKQDFHAQTAARSWGDRLANKWNFIVPGLPEAVEIHMGRLGQTGEQVAIASSLVARCRTVAIEDYLFRVPAPEDRLIISTLQRMYRHFNARLCDIVDTAKLIQDGTLDYDDLRYSAQACGLWEGIATYLAVVSDYVAYFSGEGLKLPSVVMDAARFGGDRIRFRRGFLRFPILPYSAKLYASELTTLMLSGELGSTVRLSLLPCLATAAALGQKITGSDKGIW